MGKSLAELTAEIRAINVEKGWRPAAGGPGDRRFGDFIALLHSEVSEALEAYRDWRLADRTGEAQAMSNAVGDTRPVKPEGVGSELADVLIRLLDMCDVFGLTPFDMEYEIADVEPTAGPHLTADGFGTMMTCLHAAITDCYTWAAGDRRPAWLQVGDPFIYLLRMLVQVAQECDVDLGTEVDRKLAYNRTRPYRHGGRAL